MGRLHASEHLDVWIPERICALSKSGTAPIINLSETERGTLFGGTPLKTVVALLFLGLVSVGSGAGLIHGPVLFQTSEVSHQPIARLHRRAALFDGATHGSGRYLAWAAADQATVEEDDDLAGDELSGAGLHDISPAYASRPIGSADGLRSVHHVYRPPTRSPLLRC